MSLVVMAGARIPRAVIRSVVLWMALITPGVRTILTQMEDRAAATALRVN
jgi:hypothetical protein